MNRMHSRSRFSLTGFTLIELMVGLAIGMLATVIIIQVMSVFEAQRRTTSGSADAQTNGGIALHTIGRDVQMAGYPLFPGPDSAMECAAATLTFGATGITSVSPVTITHGAAAAGDAITIRYGSSSMGGTPVQISAVDVPTKTVTVGTNLGCNVNDITLISNGPTCAMSSVTAVSAAGVAPVTITLENATAAAGKANLACLGVWSEITYAVNPATGNLDRTIAVNGAAPATTPSVVGVASIQAQYGISATAGSNQVTQWVNATGTWAAPTVDDRKRIKSVRIAVVARNDKLEMAAVTTACSSVNSAAPTGLCAWEGDATSPAPAIDLSADANWARYRYRVFETIIPVRNVIWAKDTL